MYNIAWKSQVHIKHWMSWSNKINCFFCKTLRQFIFKKIIIITKILFTKANKIPVPEGYFTYIHIIKPYSFISISPRAILLPPPPLSVYLFHEVGSTRISGCALASNSNLGCISSPSIYLLVDLHSRADWQSGKRGSLAPLNTNFFRK